MKKILMSVLAVLVAATMLITFAACGGNDVDETETTTAAPDVTDAVDAPADETTAAPVEEDSSVEESSVADVEETSAVEGESEAEAPAAPESKADIVALYNEATANAAKAGYKKTTTTELRQLEMGAIGKFDMVRTEVGKFLGEGTNTESFAKGKGANGLVSGKLSEADVTSANCKLSADGKYYEITLTVKNEKNPLKNKSALNRLTNDYKDINEMRDGLADAGATVETIDCTVTTAKVTAKVAVEDKTISSLDYTISTDAYLTNVKYVVRVKTVTGTIYTTVKYSGFSY